MLLLRELHGGKREGAHRAAASSLDIPQCWHEPRPTGAPIRLSVSQLGAVVSARFRIPRPPGRPVAKARTGTLSGLAGMARGFPNPPSGVHQRNDSPPCELKIPGWSGASTGAIVECDRGVIP